MAADLQGYGSFTQCPKSSPEFTGRAQGNSFTRTFGPQIKYHSGKLEPFGEVLLGGAHSNFYANACNKNTGECGSESPSNNAFALAIGGGVDIAVSSKFAIRLVNADYELTRFGDNFTEATTDRATSAARLQIGPERDEELWETAEGRSQGELPSAISYT